MVGKVNALRVPPQPLAEEVEAAAVAAQVDAGDSLSSSVIQHDKSCKNCYQLSFIRPQPITLRFFYHSYMTNLAFPSISI